jgi:hypothetical protein
MNAFIKSYNGRVSFGAYARGDDMNLILLIVLIILLLGVLPTWPHSRNWGYYPGGILGTILLILIILMLMGRI